MDVSSWLRSLGLGGYAEAFRANDVDAEALSRLTAEDLIALGVISVGHRRKLLAAIAMLEDGTRPAAAGAIARVMRPVEPERRQLTVLFCDLLGATGLAAPRDPEDLNELKRAYEATCADVIDRFEGRVARTVGDGVLVYFGWPRAHEDDAERAVRAGLELVQAIGRFSPLKEMRLRAAAGIATGHVVIGRGARDQDAVTGEPPELAARLQAIAAPGAVVISEGTRRLVGGLFELDELGPQCLEGFAEPVSAWRVGSERGTEGRFEARQSGGLTPLVGREEEISLLLHRWRQAKDGEGQVVLLSGEPGIGKSRIARELRTRIAEEPHLRFMHQCSPYHQTSPLQPVIDRLERAAGFEGDDRPATKLDKLEAMLARGTESLDEAVPLIATLLGISPGDRYPLPEPAAQRQKQRTLEVLVDQLEGLGRQQPLLMIFEDAQWMDPSTSELLELTIERIRRLPVLLLITFRPGFTPPWRGRHVATLSLAGLSRRQVIAMVAVISGSTAVPCDVLEQIAERTDGVPLFVEELTKMVLESGLLVATGDRDELAAPLPPVAIPATLHDSLMARLDRLGGVKEIAQISAVIGREFSQELLEALMSLSGPELAAALDQLVAAELIFRRGVPPHTSYRFKHALVQDVAYGTLLEPRRQQLHARIAEVLERRFPEQAEAHPELLAHHCIKAGLVDKAIDYLHQGARRTIARSAMTEATALLTQALDALTALPTGAGRNQKELDLQIALGAALISTKGWAAPEVGKTYTRARELCTEEAQTPQLLAALSGLFVHHLHWSSKQVALQTAEELLRLAERQQDVGAQAAGHRSLGVGLLYSGQLLSAMTHFERALALYDSTDRASPVYLWGPDTRVASLLFSALILLFRGYPDRALARNREGLAAAFASGHPYTTSQALYLTCWLHQVRGGRCAVRERAAALMTLASEHGFSAWSANATMLHGWAVAGDGAAEAGIAQLGQGLAALEAMGVRQHTPSFLGLLAGLHIGLENPVEAVRLLDEALARVDRLDERWFEAELYRLKGEALLSLPQSNHARAKTCFAKALEVARGQQAKLWELRAATSLARLRTEAGEGAEARDLLAPIYRWFTEGFDTRDLRTARALLDQLR